MMSERNEMRFWGVDIARISAAFMVVLLHVCESGGALTGATGGDWYGFSLVKSFSIGAVDLFALISGFVGMGSRHRISSAIRLYVQVWITGVVLACGVLFLGGPADIRRAVFPVVFNEYWYISAYLGLFIFMPVITFGVERIGWIRSRCILVVSVIVLPVISNVWCNDPFLMHRGYSMVWLGILYVVGAILRQYPIQTRTFEVALIGLVCLLATWGQLILFHAVPAIEKLFHGRDPLVQYTSPTVLVMSIALFVLLTRLTGGGGRRFVAFVAPASLGTYLLHVHPAVWNWIWVGGFSHCGFGLGLLWAVLIFCGLVVVEKVRISIFQSLSIDRIVCSFVDAFANRALRWVRRAGRWS